MENLYVFAVVPHAGTWIEIRSQREAKVILSVVPHAGTWIEICYSQAFFYLAISRSPRGNVD